MYALDATTGQVQWQTNLGRPVPRSELPCGNIDPTGITSTPVVDPRAGWCTSCRSSYRLITSSSLSTSRRAPSGFAGRSTRPGRDPKVEQQRGALALARDQVLVAYGGLYGDCGNYKGFMIGAPADGGGDLTTYEVPAARAAAIWAPPGPVVDNNSVFVATGNSIGSSDPDLSNSVLRLSLPALQLQDSWTARNRDELSRSDTDLGSTSPVPVGNGLVFVVGKEGVGYLIRADRLGGTGGEVFFGPVCRGFGGTAWKAPLLFVPCRNELVALRIEGEQFSVAWRKASINAGSPIVTGDTVWAIDLDAGQLHAYGAADGQEQASIAVGDAANFATPAAGNGLVVVAADRRVLAVGN